MNLYRVQWPGGGRTPPPLPLPLPPGRLVMLGSVSSAGSPSLETRPSILPPPRHERMLRTLLRVRGSSLGAG